jgi:Periplasmic copper-binding protein (NosD)
MKPSVFCIVVLAIFLLTLATFSPAQAPRTWVSSTGDDVNSCIPAAPCKTFAGAISKTAASGEINCLTPGGFGPVIINKAITIDCTGTYGSVLASSNSTAISINITASGSSVVRLRGLSISGQGVASYGVRILAAVKVTIEDSVIDGFSQHGVSLENAATTPAQLFISNVTIRNNLAGNAVNITPTGSSTASVSIIGSRLLSSGGGVFAANSDVAVTGCMIAGNAFGVTANSGGTVRISGNTISENTTGLSAKGGTIASYSNNAVSGNVTNGNTTQLIGLQ